MEDAEERRGEEERKEGKRGDTRSGLNLGLDERSARRGEARRGDRRERLSVRKCRKENDGENRQGNKV